MAKKKGIPSTKAKNRGRKYIAKVWKELISAGKKAKNRFNEDVTEAMDFFDGPHERAFANSKAMDWDDWLKFSINKTSEVVTVVGPALFWTRPVRTVMTRSQDRKKLAFAKVLEEYLNFTPQECHPTLKDSSRKAIIEALVKGRGVLWTAIDRETGLICSEFVTVDDIIVDPDARDMQEAMWIARRRSEPAWLVKDLFKDSADEIDAYAQSVTAKAQYGAENELVNQPPGYELDGGGDAPIRHGKTADLVVYWEIFSKMGVGVRSRLAQDHLEEFEGIQDDVLEKHIIIAEGMDMPLHIDDWPAPLHLDGDWFCTFLDFFWKPPVDGAPDSWPLGYLKTAMGEQKALDYIASFLLTKAKHSARELVGVKRELGEQAKRQVIRGRDREIIVVDSVDPNESLRSMVDFLQPPQGGAQDLMNMFNMVNELFEQRTGLGELLYGSTRRSMRSAREAEIKDRNSRLRIEDMAMVVEDWQSKVARKEAILARFLLEPEDIAKVVNGAETYGFTIEVVRGGQPVPKQIVEQMFPVALDYYDTEEEAIGIAQQINSIGNEMGLFARHVPVDSAMVWRDAAKGDSDDDSLEAAEAIVREYSISIEATSARRPDRNWQIDQVDRMFEHVGGPALQVGDLDTYNGVLKMFYEVMEVPKQYRRFLSQAPPPEEMMAPPGGAPGQIPAPQTQPALTAGALPVMPGSEAAIIGGGT